MFVVTVHFHIHPPFVESFRAAVLRQAKNSIEREPDCKQFDVLQNPEDQNHFFLYEVYTDSAAFAAHRETPYFADFFSKIGEMVADKQFATFARIEP